MPILVGVGRTTPHHTHEDTDAEKTEVTKCRHELVETDYATGDTVKRSAVKALVGSEVATDIGKRKKQIAMTRWLKPSVPHIA